MIYKILPLILTVVLVIAQRDRFGREHAIGLDLHNGGHFRSLHFRGTSSPSSSADLYFCLNGAGRPMIIDLRNKSDSDDTSTQTGSSSELPTTINLTTPASPP